MNIAGGVRIIQFKVTMKGERFPIQDDHAPGGPENLPRKEPEKKRQ
jgi:hypothetical protein